MSKKDITSSNIQCKTISVLRTDHTGNMMRIAAYAINILYTGTYAKGRNTITENKK